MATEAAEHLQQRVRERIAMRRAGEGRGMFSLAPGAALELPPRPLPHIDPGRKKYRLGELTAFYDRDFLMLAYLAVLGREPDTRGLDSRLRQLREGQMSRVELLMRMRYGAEGKARAVSIAGLHRAFALDRLYAVPVLGFFARGLRALVYLPRLLRDLEEMRGAMAMHRNDVDDRLSLIVDHQNRTVPGAPTAQSEQTADKP